MADKATGATSGGSPVAGEPPAAQDVGSERVTMRRCPVCGRVWVPDERWCYGGHSSPHRRATTRPVELVAADDYERVVAERDKARYEAVCATSTVRMRRAVSDAAHQQGDSSGFGGTRKPRVAPEAVRDDSAKTHRCTGCAAEVDYIYLSGYERLIVNRSPLLGSGEMERAFVAFPIDDYMGEGGFAIPSPPEATLVLRHECEEATTGESR